MQTAFIEVTQSVEGGMANWGKFQIGRWDGEERTRPSYLGRLHLLTECGWGDGGGYITVMDLQTGEGAIFRPGGLASHDLNQRHQIWVCPMFEPFLTWLYRQDLTDLDRLPHLVELPKARFAIAGYRRRGPSTRDSRALTLAFAEHLERCQDAECLHWRLVEAIIKGADPADYTK